MLDADPLPLDALVIAPYLLEPLLAEEEVAEGERELFGRGPQNFIRVFLVDREVFAGLGVEMLGKLLLIGQESGHLLELLVFEQAQRQLTARVFGLFAVFLGCRLRQQHLRLELDQFGRKHHKLLGDDDVIRLHLIQIVQILRCDLRDPDVVDAHASVLDEIDEQVEGALEDVESNLIAHVLFYLGL